MIPTPAWRESRPEALADVPGPPDLALTRAVIQYWDRHEIASVTSSPNDIGIALVLEGQYPASASVVDLGSTRVKELDLSGELVVLGWVQSATLRHVGDLLRPQPDEGRVPERSETEAAEVLAPYCIGLALRVLGDLGFSAVTRPAFLRIGFRDVQRDLDTTGAQDLRISLGAGCVARVGFDPDNVTLQVDVEGPHDAPFLEARIIEAFAGADVRRILGGQEAAGDPYQVRLPLPQSIMESRGLLQRIRVSLGRLIARFEPANYQAIERQLETFGIRDSLKRFHRVAPPGREVAVRVDRGSAQRTVH